MTLQLVQVVKADRSHDTALNRFLLRRALRSPLVCGHALYWALAAEIDKETHVLNVASCTTSRCAELRRPSLPRELVDFHSGTRSELLVKRLAAISAKLSSVKSNRDHELRKLLSEVVLAPTFQLPLSPYMVCAGLNVEKCRVLGSAKAPLWLEFRNAVAGAAPHVVIFKTGDDLRQDQLTLQLLRSMDALWRARGLDLRMSPYGASRRRGTRASSRSCRIVGDAVRDHARRALPACAPLLKSVRKLAAHWLICAQVRKLAAAKEAYYGSDALLKWLTRAAGVETSAVSFGPPGSFRHAGLAPPPPTTLPPRAKWRTAREAGGGESAPGRLAGV